MAKLTRAEKEALSRRIVCPTCRAGVGRPCLSQSRLYADASQRVPATIKNAHQARIDKVLRTLGDDER